MQNRLWKTTLLFALATSTSFATVPNYKYGLTLSSPVIAKDPPNLYAVRLSAWYQPQSWIWNHLRIYWDLSAGHWWVTSNTPNKSLNIIALAPIFRVYFNNNETASPFINVSIGLTYLSQTKIAKQNLGMHFSFQDQVGVGLTFGKSQQISVTATVMHYSNGSLCNRNSGITVPLILGIEYAFA